MVKKISIFIFVVLITLTGCSSSDTSTIQQATIITEDINGINLQQLNHYDIKLVFDPVEAKVIANQRIDYINNEESILENIYIHLYPNSYKRADTAPFLFDSFDEAYPDGFKPGSINISNLWVNGDTKDYQLQGNGETIMNITLKTPLKPGEWTSIQLEYTVKLPPATERFGYGEDTYNFGNWYPIVAVFDETGWNLDPYYPIGDPFYSDVSNYNVTIDTPSDYVVAASGNILSDEVKDSRRIWEIEAKLMRDFAWVAGKNFEVVDKEVDGTVLKMYFIKDSSLKNEMKELATKAGENSLKIFNERYGKYPYGQYSVVQTNFPSGMEYPGIVFIGKQYYDKAWEDYLEIVIVHETAHQWWYGVVGNDEIDEAWLDESMAAYSEVVYFTELYGEEQGQRYHKLANEDQYQQVMKSLYDPVVLKPLSEFKGWEDYGPLVYSKGAVFLNEIRNTYGKDKFNEIMSSYFDTYRFMNATTEDFQEVCEKVTGDDMDVLFENWLLK